jgi:hypothetical protein
MYTFNLDKIISYELGTDEPTTLAANKINLFTASADDILSRMGKVGSLRDRDNGSWSCCVCRCLSGLGSWRRF